MKSRSISISISLSALSIAQSKGCVAGEAITCVSIVSLAEDAHCYASVRGKEEPVEAFDALIVGVVSVAILDCVLAVYH